MRQNLGWVVMLALASGCHGNSDAATEGLVGSGSGSGAGSAIAPGKMAVTKDTQAQIDKDKAAAAAIDDGIPNYVPAEFKAGASRWKDTGVYVDGQPIGFLSFGELPIALKPTWVKDKVSAEKRPHTDDPGWRWSKARYYKFNDYLKSVHIDPHTIKEMHVYGPKFTQSIIVKTSDLLAKNSDEFMFRFGVSVAGKPLPQMPLNFGNGKTPDKISSVMIYITKKPPILDDDAGVFVLDGKEQTGVPYYGEPVRGGVRLYIDDKLVGIIKRQELDAKVATKTPNGDLHWGLADFAKAKGIDLSKVVEGYVVRDERRQDKLTGDDLRGETFSANAQAKGGVMLDKKNIRASAITMFTHPLKADDLPKVEEDEEF